jgi:hypothetical protein
LGVKIPVFLFSANEKPIILCVSWKNKSPKNCGKFVEKLLENQLKKRRKKFQQFLWKKGKKTPGKSI